MVVGVNMVCEICHKKLIHKDKVYKVCWDCRCEAPLDKEYQELVRSIRKENYRIGGKIKCV